jgi:hypothetical protein
MYTILRRAEGGLRRVSDEETHISNNKHVLAYGNYSIFNSILESTWSTKAI